MLSQAQEKLAKLMAPEAEEEEEEEEEEEKVP